MIWLYLDVHKPGKLETQAGDRLYQASDLLVLSIANMAYKVKRDSYICDFTLVVFTAIFYNNYAKDLPVFIGCEITAILLIAFVQYKLVIGKGKFISATAIAINVSTEYIVIKTTPFKGPIWFRIKQANIRMAKTDIKLHRLPNPYLQVFRLSKTMLKLNGDGAEAFILTGYFDQQLGVELPG